VTCRVQINLEVAETEAPDRRRLGRLARRVLAAEGAASGEVGVVLTDDEGMQALNRQYLGRDGPTDVLAFGLQEQDESRPAFVTATEGTPYLGDVAISLERAREQAAAYGHDWQREVDLLLVHGLLHLLGYDDGEVAACRRMEARQEQLLASFEGRRSLLEAFRVAVAGLGNMVVTQRNVRIHLVLAALVVILGIVLKLALWEWAALGLTIVLVLVIEALNSAVEALVDLVSPERRSLARRAKDLAAAAVLLAALFSLVMAGILFMPRLWVWLFAK